MIYNCVYEYELRRMTSYNDPPPELVQALGTVDYWYTEFSKEAKTLKDQEYMGYCARKWKESSENLGKVKNKLNYKSHYDRGI